MVASHGPFQTACDFRGVEKFLLDLSLNPEFALALLDKVTGAIEGLLHLAMQAGGKWFDLVELPGDDYAGNTNLLISPVMFRKFVKPCLARLVNTIKEYNPKVSIMLHSDGAITKLIPDLLELGVDVLHPLEPLPATDIPAVKANFGNESPFWAGLTFRTRCGAHKRMSSAKLNCRMAQLGPGGGYILAPSNHLQADVPAENVVTLFDTATSYKYKNER